MKTYILSSLSVLTLCSCTPDPTAKLEVINNDRVTIKRVAIIEDELAYHERRGVYIIKDNKTGFEYIGVSGIGISETGKHQEGKSTFSDER